MASQRSQVFQAFKLSGLTLEAPAARFILDAFKSHTTEQLTVALEAVLRAVKSLVLSSSVVPLSAIQEASRALESSVAGDAIDDVMLISAAECPNLEFAAWPPIALPFGSNTPAGTTAVARRSSKPLLGTPISLRVQV